MFDMFGCFTLVYHALDCVAVFVKNYSRAPFVRNMSRTVAQKESVRDKDLDASKNFGVA